ncbi:hypothetical protein ACHAWF_018931, partial [Thalassiosira exigua]
DRRRSPPSASLRRNTRVHAPPTPDPRPQQFPRQWFREPASIQAERGQTSKQAAIKSMPPPRRSLPVRSRAPGNLGRQNGGAEASRRTQSSTAGETAEDHGDHHRKNSASGGGGDISSDEPERGRDLVALLANGKQVTVKVKLFSKEFPRRRSKSQGRKSKEELDRRTKEDVATRSKEGTGRRSKDDVIKASEKDLGKGSKAGMGKRSRDGTVNNLTQNNSWENEDPWECHSCGRDNLAKKKRCGTCQAWRGGTRTNIHGARKSKTPLKGKETPHKAKSPPKEVEEAVPEEKSEAVIASAPVASAETTGAEATAALETSAAVTPKVEKEDDGEEYQHDDVEEEVSMGARLPKRKRTNRFFSSLSPAVIQATTKARAEAYAAAPPSPQLASRSSARRRGSLVRPVEGLVHESDRERPPAPHPAAVAAESAIDEGGAVPDELIGKDGNLFYCRICLGVGEVVCCDSCPHVYHPKCLPVGPSKASLENDDDPWYCHKCIGGGKAQSGDGRSGAVASASADPAASSPVKKRRKTKERCSECRRKETKANPCVPCPGQGCDQFFHLECPSRVDEDGIEDAAAAGGEGGDPPTPRMLCISCRALLADSDRGGVYFEYDQAKLEGIYGARQRGRLESVSPRRSRGRGSSRGRGGSRGLRRMSSTEERMKRHQATLKGTEELGVSIARGGTRSRSSGFQSPYVENDDDDEGVGPESLADVEQPLSSTPAFFFFLLHNRSIIEKSLYRKKPFFRGMAKGTARNEVVAHEGAAIWIEMSQKEQDEWVEVAMKDFEQRVVAWKEKEVIEAMIKTAIKEQEDTEEKEAPEEAPALPPEDEAHIANYHARLNRFGRVNTQPIKAGSVQSVGNPILLELLNDARFRPLPLVDTQRAQEDLTPAGGTSEKTRLAVQQFAVRGPIETSLGDDCMGCTRGWSHYCQVLKRPLPGSEHRAKLQPPVSSLTATRIGLGLKLNLPSEDDPRTDKEEGQLPRADEDLGIVGICPNYQPRDGFSLSTPSLRLDDTTSFIENAMATKVLTPDDSSAINGSAINGSAINGSAINSSAINSSAIIIGSPSPRQLEVPRPLGRGLLPLRGRKRKASFGDGIEDGEGGSGKNNREAAAPARKEKRGLRYRCGGCGTVQLNPLGCTSCRRAQLVLQTARQGFCLPTSASDELLKMSCAADWDNYSDGFVRPMCVMLGRSNLNDTSISGRKKQLDGGVDKIGLSLTKESWTPCAILPPIPKRLPVPKPPDWKSKLTSEKCGRGSEGESLTSVSSSLGRSNTHSDDELWECVKCAHRNESSRSRCVACHGWRGGKRLNNSKSSRPRTCTSKVGEMEASQDRNALGLKHKGHADELYRKCLLIACCGILQGMIRRDPMRLFAEPVPSDVSEYYEVIKDPIDFGAMRRKIVSSEYTSLKQFITDARRLCINACVFNAADSLYAKTAKNIYDALEVMYVRAKKWITILKNTHASSFIANEDGKGKEGVDTFKDVKLMWPGAAELLEDGDWLKKLALSDFTRTRENEIAYYGSLAIQRAAAAARASLATAPDAGGYMLPVARRSHEEDDLLRKRVDKEAALLVGPIQLKDVPDWREHQLLKLLKRVQRRRMDGRLSSESGCARCDGVTTADDANKAASLLRSKFKRTVDATKTRVAASRLSQSTGLASRNARAITSERSVRADTPLELVGQVSTESMVSVRGSRVHGWGLFADHPFRKGEVVAEYIGEYVSDAVADLRENNYREQRIQDYQFRVDGSLVSTFILVCDIFAQCPLSHQLG